MIKINLISAKPKKRRKVTPKQLYIFIGIFILEIIFLVFWYAQTSKEREEITNKNIELSKKIEELKKVKEEWTVWEEEKKILEKQYQIFESLKNDKVGPLNMLQFFSYILKKFDDISGNIEELKSLELSGWDIRWNPQRLWIQKITEKEGVLTVQGSSIDHEDVAEFYKRMETNPYCINLEPGLQQQKEKKEFDIKYIEWTMNCNLNYNVELEEAVKVGLK